MRKLLNQPARRHFFLQALYGGIKAKFLDSHGWEGDRLSCISLGRGLPASLICPPHPSYCHPSLFQNLGLRCLFRSLGLCPFTRGKSIPKPKSLCRWIAKLRSKPTPWKVGFFTPLTKVNPGTQNYACS